MSDEEDRATKFVIHLLKEKGPLTTREIEDMSEENVLAYLMLCPDETMGFLKELRTKGLIEGEFSAEKKSWVWRLK